LNIRYVAFYYLIENEIPFRNVNSFDLFMVLQFVAIACLTTAIIVRKSVFTYASAVLALGPPQHPAEERRVEAFRGRQTPLYFAYGYFVL
jgi:hypothetical protein